ncbi:CRISPR-associated protein Cas4 [Parathermosynechococcus lividus]
MDDDEYVLLSALQHFAFCARQCALIHTEQVWAENIYTLRGARVHANVHTPGQEWLDGERRVERSVPLYSDQLRIRGVADVIEFSDRGVPYPIEYKAGGNTSRLADAVQLCAQALCLEEMLGCSLDAGAIFYARARRRREVRFVSSLRERTVQIIKETRALLASQALPLPVADKRCRDCSLIEACMPDAVTHFAARAAKNPAFTLTEL